MSDDFERLKKAVVDAFCHRLLADPATTDDLAERAAQELSAVSLAELWVPERIARIPYEDLASCYEASVKAQEWQAKILALLQSTS